MRGHTLIALTLCLAPLLLAGAPGRVAAEELEEERDALNELLARRRAVGAQVEEEPFLEPLPSAPESQSGLAPRPLRPQAEPMPPPEQRSTNPARTARSAAGGAGGASVGARPAPASNGPIYSYVDANGTLSFTDELFLVPTGQTAETLQLGAGQRLSVVTPDETADAAVEEPAPSTGRGPRSRSEIRTPPRRDR